MIKIEPYKPVWRDEFNTLGQAIRRELGELALRIDHIGSTAVPALAAKDRIDIQVTVRSLDAAIEAAFQRAGYRRVEWIIQDHVPPGFDGELSEWEKWTFVPSAGRRMANVHVRLEGRANQRYALLFRDYLRSYPAVAQAYSQVKTAVAKYHAENQEAYYDIKDPVCDIIIDGAELWAASVHWQVGPTDA